MQDDDMAFYELFSTTPDPDGYDSNPIGCKYSRDNCTLKTYISCPWEKSSIVFPSSLLFDRFAKQKNYRVVFICGFETIKPFSTFNYTIIRQSS